MKKYIIYFIVLIVIFAVIDLLFLREITWTVNLVIASLCSVAYWSVDYLFNKK